MAISYLHKGSVQFIFASCEGFSLISLLGKLSLAFRDGVPPQPVEDLESRTLCLVQLLKKVERDNMTADFFLRLLDVSFLFTLKDKSMSWVFLLVSEQNSSSFPKFVFHF